MAGKLVYMDGPGVVKFVGTKTVAFSGGAALFPGTQDQLDLSKNDRPGGLKEEWVV